METKITAKQSDHLEISRLNSALCLFFDYADQRSFVAIDPPPEVQEALGIIMAYYDERLKNIVKLFPNEYLLRIYDSRDLYAYAWGKFWENGHGIEMRTPAGVYAWLKRVISNHKYDMRKKHRYLVPWDDQIEEENASRFEITGILLEKLGSLGDNDDDYGRYKLLHEFVEKALTKLGERQQQVIKLAMEKHSLEEIACTMNFPSRNSVSSFKKRAFKKLAGHLYILFIMEFDRPTGPRRKKVVIEDWIERFYERGGEKRRRYRRLFSESAESSQDKGISFPELPLAIQSIITQHWQRLEDDWRSMRTEQ